MAVELATGFVSLVPSARGITSAVSREMSGPAAAAAASAGSRASQSFATRFASGLESAGKRVSKAGDKMTIGLTLPLVLLGKRALDASLRARTATRQIALVFEQSAGSVRAFAKENAASFGLTERAMQSALAGFGGLTLSIGFTSKEAAGMTTQAGELAGALVNARPDLGSFDEVMASLSGGITENREEMKRWGINVSDADIKARLASKGLEGLEGNALKQARAQAFMELAMEGSALSLKDFRDNGVDPTIKAQNEMAAEAGEASEAFGKNLTPVVTDVSKVLGGLLERFNNLSPGMKAVATRAAIVVAALGPVLSITGRLARGVAGLVTGTGKLVKTTGKVVSWGTSAEKGGGKAVRAFGRVIVSAAQATAAVVKTIAIQIARWTVLGVQALLHAAKVAAAWLISLGPIGLVIAAVAGAAALIIKHWDTIQRFVTRAARAVVDFLKRHWPLILGILAGPMGLAVVAIIKHWDKIRGAVKAALDWILSTTKRVWGATWDAIRNIGRRIVGWFQSFRGIIQRIFSNAARWLLTAGNRIITGLWNGLKLEWKGVLAWFGFFRHVIFDKFIGAAKWLFKAGKNILTGLWDGMKDIWSNVVDWIKDIPGRIIDLKGPVAYDRTILVPAGRAIMGGLFEGLKGQAGQIYDFVSGIAGDITKPFRAGFDWMGNLLSKPFSQLKNLFGFGGPDYDFSGVAELVAGQGGGSTAGLVGHARDAFGFWRAMFPSMDIGGWRAQGSVPGSDHPKGKALDLMTMSGSVANLIIGAFLRQPGAKYWIWNRRSADARRGWQIRDYNGPSPHTDHVHLSYFQRGAWNTRGGLGITHPGEMILPAQLANAMRALPGGPRGGATAARTGPAVVMENVNLNDGVDIDLLNRRLEFEVAGGRL